MAKKLRVSYSLLSAWGRGQTDQAIATYFHLETPITAPMKAGKIIHEAIAKKVRTSGVFPDWLTPITPNKPLPEHKIVVPYNELFDLSAVFDCLDSPDLFEWKTGSKDSLGWAREAQVPFYFLVAELAKIPIEKAYLIHYNQYKRASDFTLIWNNEELRETARNFIDTLAPDVYDYFIKEGLI